MNANSFLNCLNFTGLNTGTYVLGLYSFSSGDANFVYNQAYSTGYNYVSGYPFAPALPLVYEGAGTNVSGIFSGNQAYQVSNAFTRDFGILLFLNNLSIRFFDKKIIIIIIDKRITRHYV